MRILKIAGAVFLAGIAAAIMLIVLPILRCSQPQWPSIENPALLVRDCALIIADAKTGPLPKQLWPKSIENLNPLEVMIAHQNYAEIVISTGGIGPRSSFMIFADRKHADEFRASEVKLHKTENPQIFKLY